MASWMQPMIYIMVVVIVGGMGFKMIMEFIGKTKKPKKVEIPRDTMERQHKAFKQLSRAKLNKTKIRHTLWMTGDEIFIGYKVGDVLGIIPNPYMYRIIYRKKWWYFWHKPIVLHIDPELCTDWNAKEIIIEGRGFKPITENQFYVVPVHGTTKIELIEINRCNAREFDVSLQTIFDRGIDLDIIPKIAMRGSQEDAFSEIGRFEEMPSIPHEKVQKAQRQMYEDNSGIGE